MLLLLPEHMTFFGSTDRWETKYINGENGPQLEIIVER